MTQPTPTEIINRFNHAFLNHDPTALNDLIADDCVMEAIQPAPDGARYEGREACLTFWKALTEDHSTQFERKRSWSRASTRRSAGATASETLLRIRCEV